MMLHGFALSTRCWENLAEILVKSGYTCVLADLPDFGYSSRETAETEKLPREDIIHELMMSIDSGKWYVAGHSMGGYVALAIAAKYPDSVKNLLLYGTSGNTGVSGVFSSMMNNQVFVKFMGSFMQFIVSLDPIVKLLLVKGLSDVNYAMAYNLNKITGPLKIDGTGVGVMYSFSMLPKTDFYAVQHFSPVLYMNGNRDDIIPDSDRDRLRAYLPDNSVDYTVVGGGHMFIENFAEETAKITLDFLAKNK